MPTPEISVVLPCFLGARLARRSVDELSAFLSETFSSFEIVVVDDGGGDFDGGWPTRGSVRLIRLPTNRGKGAATRVGMLDARGAVRCLTDVDLPYELDLFAAAAAYINEHGFHLVVGDRTLPSSSYSLVVSPLRRVASAVFSRVVGTFLTGGFFDTQCGFKAFRGDVAAELFRLSRVDRFAFDVELLYVALLHRLDIKRVPVRLRNNETSAVRLVRDSMRMLLDVGRIRLARQRGRYHSALLSSLVQSEFESIRGRRPRIAPRSESGSSR